MGRITRALDALFDRSAKNVPAYGSAQTSAMLAQVLGLDMGGGTNAADPAQQIREGYNKNVIVYRCVQEVARSASSVNLIVYKKKGKDIEEVVSHPLVDLLNRPNPFMGRAEFVETWIAYLVLSGNTYCQAITVNGGRKLQELWPLTPSQVDPHVVNDQLLGYKVQTPRGQITFPVDPVTGRCEVLHTKQWNPSDPFQGQSPLMAAALSTDIHNEISQWTRALLANSAQPTGALTMEAAQGGIPNKLTDEEFNRLKAELTEAYSGTKNAGRPMLLEGGLKWQAMGLSPKEMDWLNSRAATAREIALTFGVPPMLLGIPGDNTYSNQKEARLWFWSDTVLPILSLALSSLNRFIEASFPGQGMFVGFDEDTIPALAARREEVWDRVNKSEVLKVNEKREALGYEALEEPGGDTVLVSSNVKPLEQAIETPPDPVALAEAVTRAKQPAADPAAASSANDNQRVPARVRQAAKYVCQEIKHSIGSGLELKYSNQDWRGIEIEARSRLLTAAELNLREKVKRYLRGVAAEVTRVIKAGDFAGVDHAVLTSMDELEDILSAAYYGIGEVVSDRFLAAFKSTNAPETKGLLDTFWSLMSPFVEVQTGKKVTLITETTREDVRQAVSEGLKTGKPMQEIADLVGNSLRDSSAGRALTIAATEAHAATSYAAEASAKSVGVEMEREWAIAGGERTRPSHQRADGQIRAMDEPFSVGGSSLMYPGDPDGAAKEVINCRCAVLYNPKGL